MTFPPKPWPVGLAETPEPLVRRVLATNPSAFTYTGTQSYIVGAGDEIAVIDPGPLRDEHIDALIATIGDAKVTAICCTHTHHDHSPAAAPLATVGASFTSVTFTVNCLSNIFPAPSVTRTRTEYVFRPSKLNTPFVRNCPFASAKLPLSSLPAPVTNAYVNAFDVPIVVADRFPTAVPTPAFSATAAADKLIPDGPPA